MMSREKIHVVTGTPGAGKTTVMDEVMERLQGKGEKIEVVNYGDVMVKTALDKGLVKNRDEIRKLPIEKQHKIQRLAAQAITKKAKEKPVIVDTHCTIKTPKGYLPGLPEWVLDELLPNLIVLIEADPEEIVGRRRKDAARKRDVESLDEIREHQQVNMATAMAYAALTGAPVKIVKNHDGKLEEAVRQTLAVLR